MGPKIPKFNGQIWHGPKPCGLTRRDFIQQGLATASLAMTVPTALLHSTQAGAVTLPGCPPQNRVPGGIAQVFREGGNTRSAMFFDTKLANMITTSVASDYGIA